MYLAGDIGGTKTVLALFDEVKGPHQPLEERRFESDEYGSFLDIVRAYSEATAVQPEAATLAVAGPIQGRRVQVTNLPWAIDADEVSRVLGAPVRLLNDLESIANAVPMLEADDLVTIKDGQARPEQPIAVIAPGTGLGEGFLFWDGQKYRAIPSEGGHTDFAPATPLELELLSYWQPRMGHVSYERVCSGLGIPKLYEFLLETDRYPEPSWLSADLAAADDKTPVIVQAGTENRATIARATLDLFLSILGSEAGNLVLQVLATGGVYLGGGIPPRILDELRGETFHHAFVSKGRFTQLLEKTPVQVIVNGKAALFGAANHCQQVLSGELEH